MHAPTHTHTHTFQVTSEDSIDAVWQGLMLLQIGRAAGLAWRFYGGSAAGDPCMYLRSCVCVCVCARAYNACTHTCIHLRVHVRIHECMSMTLQVARLHVRPRPVSAMMGVHE